MTREHVNAASSEKSANEVSSFIGFSERTKMKKRLSLQKLRRKIVLKLEVDDWREVWFFRPYKGVKGFLGTQDIIFVGLAPSTGHFPSRYDRFFYEQLKKHGFANAHITDIVKVRMLGSAVEEFLGNQTAFDEQLRFLMKEIGIVAPKLIVGLGHRSYNLLEQKVKGYKLIELRHYSTLRFPKNRAKLVRGMRAVEEAYRKEKLRGRRL